MSRKPQTLILSFPYPDPQDSTGKVGRYRVESVVNSVEINPLAFLSKREVEALCEHRYWTVKIIPSKEA